MNTNKNCTDRITVQMVAAFIGLCALLTMSGIILLACMGRDIPDPLSTLGGAAIGALGSLLARTTTTEGADTALAPASVEVNTAPSLSLPSQTVLQGAIPLKDVPLGGSAQVKVDRAKSAPD